MEPKQSGWGHPTSPRITSKHPQLPPCSTSKRIGWAIPLPACSAGDTRHSASPAPHSTDLEPHLPGSEHHTGGDALSKLPKHRKGAAPPQPADNWSAQPQPRTRSPQNPPVPSLPAPRKRHTLSPQCHPPRWDTSPAVRHRVTSASLSTAEEHRGQHLRAHSTPLARSPGWRTRWPRGSWCAGTKGPRWAAGSQPGRHVAAV